MLFLIAALPRFGIAKIELFLLIPNIKTLFYNNIT